MYQFTLKMMFTLLRLFRGKKFNVLRGRDDANNYSVSELFLGVLIITLGIFLLPTVAIFYYYAFVMIILNVLTLQLVLIVSQTLVTDFPYFLLTLSINQPYFLPNSIRMKVDNEGRSIKIESLPQNTGAFFANLVSELKLLVDMSTFKNVVWSVLTGGNLFQIMNSFLHILARVKPEDSALVKNYESNRKKKSKAHFLRKLCRIPFNLF